MKDKLNQIFSRIKNLLDMLIKGATIGIKKIPSNTFTSASAKKGKHQRQLNLQRIAMYVAAMSIIIVVAVLIFAPHKTQNAASLSTVAGIMQSAVPSAAVQSSEPAVVAANQETNATQPTPSEANTQVPEKPKESNKPKGAEQKKDDTPKPNEHSKEVIKMQERLMELDYMENDEPTDFYGPQTQYSLQLFQRKHGLEIDGIAGEDTLKLLYSKQAKHYTVSLGDRGTDVQELQDRLIELKYLKGSPTGYFGSDTETAVKTFQKQNDLSIDGNVGSDTRESIYDEDAKEYNKPKKKVTPTPTNKHEKSTTKIPDDKSVSSLIAFAKQQLGQPYVRGGKGPNSFDCSGFVYYCLKNIGLKLGYMTSGGWAKSSWPKVTSMNDLLAGDILCFRGHVGIYLGGGRMIDASSGQGKVRMTGNIFSSGYWKRNFICARRPL